MLKDLWKYITFLGITDKLLPFDEKAIKLMNQLSFVMILWFGILSVAGLITGKHEDLVLALSNVILFGGVLVLNRFEKTTLSKHYFLIFGLIMVSFVNILYPFGAFPLVQFITTTIFPVLLFKKNRIVAFYLTANMLMVSSVFYYHAHYTPLLDPEYLSSHPSPLIGFIIVTLIVFLIAFFFRNVGNDLERKLVEKNRYLNELIEKTQSMQEQMISSEKMASLGQLTAGIAHEINNPINFVASNVNPLKLDISELKELCARYSKLHESEDPARDLEKIREFVKEVDPEFLHQEIETLINGIEEGAGRTKQIVMDLRNFSRMDEDEFKKTDIHEGLESTLMLLKNKIKNRIQVEKQYGELPLIDCIPGKINQVFMNVLNNAAEAIPDEGTITIATLHEPREQRVMVSIKDTGVGMSLAVCRRIFEPFYTTKGIGKGTGLGLSISYGIIEKHNGSIRVESDKGRGSEFIITLPVHQTPKTA